MVSAKASPSDPCQYRTVTISVVVTDAGGAPVGGAAVTSTWHYRTTTSTESGTTGGDGTVALSRAISRATAGYAVTVDVEATKDGVTGRASTSFTPKDC